MLRPRSFPTILITLLALLLLTPSITAAGSYRWQWTNPLPQGNPLSAVVYGDDGFVAVGAGGAIVTSPDGTAWSNATAPTVAGLTAVAYGNGTYVAVGETTLIASTDGATWTSPLPDIAWGMTDVAYGNGRFVAVGWSTSYSSADGFTWTKIPDTTLDWERLRSVDFENGLFLAVPDGVTGEFFASTDGLTWQSRTLSDSLTSCHDFAYGNDRWVAACGDGFQTSTNGTYWAVKTPHNQRVFEFRYTDVVYEVLDIIYAQGRFVAPYSVYIRGNKEAGPETNGYYVSADGINWEEDSQVSLLRKSPPYFEGSIADMAYGGGRFVAVGDGGVIYTSTDADSWRLASPGARNDLNGVAYGGGRFIAGGDDGVVLSSADGITWQSQTINRTNDYLTVIHADGRYVAFSPWGITTSTDGSKWTEVSELPVEGFVPNPYGIAYGNGVWVVVTPGNGVNGDVGNLFTSDNLIDWKREDLNPNRDYYDVAYGNGRFVAVGSYGSVYTSDDGMRWTARKPLTGADLGAVAFGNGRFVAFSEYGFVYTSADGIVWTTQEAALPDLGGLTFTGTEFVFIARDGTQYATSPDGVTWTVRDTGLSAWPIVKLTSGGGKLVAVGQGGIIITGDACAFDPKALGASAGFRLGCSNYFAGNDTNAMDVAAFSEGGRTYLPVRYLATALGVPDSGITWDGTTGTVTLKKGSTTVVLRLNSTLITVNGKTTDMQVAPVTIPPGRLVLPARFVAEAFGYQVKWDEATQTVLLIAP